MKQDVNISDHALLDNIRVSSVYCINIIAAEITMVTAFVNSVNIFPPSEM